MPVTNILNAQNYWSNLTVDENTALLLEVKKVGTKAAVKKLFPQYYDVIFSPKRAGGLALLDFRKDDFVIDAGCMWGALTIPIGRTGCENVLGIDKTEESIKFLKSRIEEEKLDNVHALNINLKFAALPENRIDKIIVDGVLEWIPDDTAIELSKYYGIRQFVPLKNINPKDEQRQFLRNMHNGLKPGGILYLAIENRYDILNFIGQPDPHCNIRFITVLPRFLQSLISKLLLSRDYTNYTYSERELTGLLNEAGFKDIEVRYAFPDYRFPEYILTREGMEWFRPIKYAELKSRVKRAVVYAVETVMYSLCKSTFFAPSFIVIAKKGM